MLEVARRGLIGKEIMMADEEKQSDAPQGSEESAAFTQADVDRIVGERIARERAKFADYDELKSKVESAKSEHERALEAARAEGESKVRDQFVSRIFQSEVRLAAKEFGFHSPDDAIAHFGDAAQVVDESGEVDVKAVEKRLAEIASAKPYLTTDDSSPVATRPNIRRGTKQSKQDGPHKGAAAELLRAYSRSR